MLQFLYSSQHIRTFKKPPLHSDEVKGLLALNRKVDKKRESPTTYLITLFLISNQLFRYTDDKDHSKGAFSCKLVP